MFVIDIEMSHIFTQIRVYTAIAHGYGFCYLAMKTKPSAYKLDCANFYKSHEAIDMENMLLQP